MMPKYGKEGQRIQEAGHETKQSELHPALCGRKIINAKQTIRVDSFESAKKKSINQNNFYEKFFPR